FCICQTGGGISVRARISAGSGTYDHPHAHHSFYRSVEYHRDPGAGTHRAGNTRPSVCDSGRCCGFSAEFDPDSIVGSLWGSHRHTVCRIRSHTPSVLVPAKTADNHY
ncbi:hypothetical protein, partial [Ileibacterium valens]|uniref:hypothetical protein n=1 Tax=Ileibacterium valens TaxID=1862668 RepID=UPI003F73BB4D